MGLARTYEFLSRGGPIMVPIAICSVICVALIAERWMALSRRRVLPQKFVRQLLDISGAGNLVAMLAFLKAANNPLSRVLIKGLSEPVPTAAHAFEEAEMVGRIEAHHLERNLDHLGTLAALGPLLGLLGTVTGMIKTFAAIQVVGVGNPLELSGGIAEALINTAAGLFVAIPALIFHRLFFRRVDQYVLEMEELSQKVIKHFFRS